ncbi:type II secretion system protein GspK [Xanthobacter sp. KR7-65]|uniref:general secretion pathway protein GspK n=1 Tax=Xanthobacter sp. KR7-65 TaxID=3156612 RepID=UPI0032B4F872
MTPPEAMANAPARRPAGGSEGFILVAVLWILGALATFVTIYSLYIGTTATAAAARDETFATRSLATAAVELAASRLAGLPLGDRPRHGEVVFQMGKARVSAVFQEETARIDLNSASRQLLIGLFTVLGAEPATAEQHADRIIGWRAPPSGPDQNAELALYRDAGLSYGPRAAPFVQVDELWRVVGLSPALVEAALPHLTVFSGRAEVNVQHADPVVRAAAAAAPRPDGVEGPRPGTDAAAQVITASDAVRVVVRIDFPGGRQRFAEAVILVRNFGDAPYRMLSWRDELPLHAPGMGAGGSRG